MDRGVVERLTSYQYSLCRRRETNVGLDEFGDFRPPICNIRWQREFRRRQSLCRDCLLDVVAIGVTEMGHFGALDLRGDSLQASHWLLLCNVYPQGDPRMSVQFIELVLEPFKASCGVSVVRCISVHGQGITYQHF
jgi:hypothetical protein